MAAAAVLSDDASDTGVSGVAVAGVTDAPGASVLGPDRRAGAM